MNRRPPTGISIDHDDYYANHVGRTADGRQFFVTTPFVPAVGSDTGREFIAAYIFDQDGKITDARIDDLGSRGKLDPDHVHKILEERLADLGPVQFRRIEVRPFEIHRFETSFGLILRPPEDDADSWWVEAQPGNY